MVRSALLKLDLLASLFPDNLPSRSDVLRPGFRVDTRKRFLTIKALKVSILIRRLKGKMSRLERSVL